MSTNKVCVVFLDTLTPEFELYIWLRERRHSGRTTQHKSKGVQEDDKTSSVPSTGTSPEHSHAWLTQNLGLPTEEVKESRRVLVPLLVRDRIVVESGLRHQQSNISSC
ncbi:hypothetical protein Taro_031561 [Colocasia esculenta]|uniref:Uncharacterized protein n=1 Tax=Colocasia esculenta TaxID=4460 RepID=A0A843W1B0_COLES|nr:hypothetical protein [Colocasia esculenta]